MKRSGLICTAIAAALTIGVTIGLVIPRGMQPASNIGPTVGEKKGPVSDEQLLAWIILRLAPDSINDLGPGLSDMKKTLAGRGQATTERDLMIGFATLANDKEGRTGERAINVNFRGSYSVPYLLHRKPGMSHEAAISRLIELEKF